MRECAYRMFFLFLQQGVVKLLLSSPPLVLPRSLRIFINFCAMPPLVLTHCFFQSMHVGGSVVTSDLGLAPVLQILSVRPVFRYPRRERYSVVLSDGVYYMRAFLSVHLDGMVEEGFLQKFTVFEVERYKCRLHHGL